MKCIGYAPIENFTIFVPDKILLKDDDGIVLKTHYSLTHINIAKYAYTLASEEIKEVPEVNVSDDEWLTIDDNGVNVIKINELDSWKSKKSEELAGKAVAFKDSPLARILLAENAIYLKNINFCQLVEGLASARKSDSEPLSEVLQRLSHTQPGR